VYQKEFFLILPCQVDKAGISVQKAGYYFHKWHTLSAIRLCTGQDDPYSVYSNGIKKIALSPENLLKMT